MRRDTQVSVQAGIVRATYRGDMAYDATTDMLRTVGALASEHGSERLLFDLREANYQDYHLAIIRHAEEGPALGIDRSFRIALLGSVESSMLAYMEAVAVNRGFWVKAFTDESEALAWLKGAASGGSA